MTREEYLDNSNLISFNTQKINELENLYGGKIRDLNVKKILSSAGDKSLFLDGIWRALSYNEIVNFDQYNKTNLKEKHLIPIFDILDDTFIVYNIDTGSYAKYNIIDDRLYENESNLREYIKEPQKLSEIIREMFGM